MVMRIPHKAALMLFASSVLAWTSPARAGDDPCQLPILAMTYNIRLDTATDGENSWRYRRDFLTGQIEVLRPALLGLQEVLPNQRADIQSDLPGYAIVGGGRDDGKMAGEASPIAIDRRLFRIDTSGTFWLSPTPQVPSLGWDAAYPRIVTWARVKHRASGTKILIINTHWDHEGRQARIESGRQLAHWIREMRKSNDAVVLLGDFNTELDDSAIIDMLAIADLRSVQPNIIGVHEIARPSTFNHFEILPPPGKFIDHIFVDTNIKVRRGMVIAQHLNGRVGSDHFPVVALLDLPTGGGRERCE